MSRTSSSGTRLAVDQLQLVLLDRFLDVAVNLRGVLPAELQHLGVLGDPLVNGVDVARESCAGDEAGAPVVPFVGLVLRNRHGVLEDLTSLGVEVLSGRTARRGIDGATGNRDARPCRDL